MNSSYSELYNKLPSFVQDILISLYGAKLKYERYGKVYKKVFKEYKAKEYDDINKETRNQLDELVNLVKYAKENTIFYREFYHNINIEDIKTIEDLKKIPILEKEMLRKRINDFYTLDESDGICSFTGGTTGKSLKVVYRKEDFQKRMAYLDAFKYRVGVTNRMRKATFSGRQFISEEQTSGRYWRNNYAFKQRLYSTFHMTTEHMSSYVDNLNKYKPQVINGFVSAIFDLAKYIQSCQIELSFQPIAIFTTSETLTTYHRQVIEEVFNCRVYNQYASAEGAPFITECKNGNLHYNMDTGIIEAHETGTSTEMLVTSFTTYGTPLIRYRIGDVVEFSDETCSCGNVHPVVTKLEGRKVDFLFSPVKGKISLSHLADVIKGLPNCIKQMQFIQESLDEINLLMVVDNDAYNESYEKMIIEEMIYRFGETMKISINIVDSIERTSGGKFRLIINKMKME